MERRAISLPLDQEPWSLARPVVDALGAAGHAAVFVGGCVRDLLLERTVTDIDLATDARPEQVEALFERCVTVGRQFGVTVVPVPGGEIEVASFRSDEAYIDGRRPTGIRPASEAEDVWRRDFTLNALVADPLAGELRDHVGGLADLAARVLRVVGEPTARLHEDRLRVLRGLRFAAQLGLQIEPATRAAIAVVEPTGLSRERIWDEWRKSLAAPDRQAWLAWVIEFGLVGCFTPLVSTADLETLAASGRLQRLPAAAAPEVAIALMLQSQDDDAAVEAWLAEEPISRDLRRRVGWLRIWGRPQAWSGLATETRREQLLRPEAGLLADAVAAWGEAWPEGPQLVAEGEALRADPPEVLLGGRDLLALGAPAGPRIGAILAELRAAQLRGELPDRGAAEALARRLIDA